ncbi:heme-binding domain-containing protein [Chryseolinea lacunae]|uniref:Heme-binding domain-containing protein n=1 Tax=Chryseolinea lacunae TaxID=2801331 RepID=A0ABS1KM74_9BACT|nr:heme-binding domain-containing protein [Chryseolinea lacunae]MBL0740559.1 heme-binding domain-containing protein [Chryseolinea lacunae]
MKLSSTKRSRILLVALGILSLIVIGMQFAEPAISNPPPTGTFAGPDSVVTILERSCYNCHSNETRLAWYDKIAPVSWLVSADVRKARSRFNFSHWDSLSTTDQVTKLWYMVNMADQGKMPLATYTAVNPSAKLSEREIRTLKNYVVALAANTSKTNGAKTPPSTPVTRPSTIPASPNGIRYIEGFRNWKVIATTNRFDNGTMRVVYGNDIAVKAITENTINPWPNGAIIAKVVWNKQAEDTTGTVRAGDFNNVQFMVRDDVKYKNTEGWGFARFSTPKLVPYGNTIAFDVDCINCHRLASANGFVFDIPTHQKY